MYRSNWCFVFGTVAAGALLVCQSAYQSEARADDLSGASNASVASTGTLPDATQDDCVAAGCLPLEGCGCCGHFYANAEAVFLASIGTQRFLTYETQNAPNNSAAHFGTSFDTGQGANEGLVATPRITLGYQGPCWGMDVRYWRMQNGKEVNDLLYQDSTGLEQVSGFRAETVDLEATRLFCWGESQMQWAFGIRYGQFDETAALAAYETSGGDQYIGYANARNAFGGVGLTTALTGVRPIGCGNFSLFYAVRASLLWDPHATNSIHTLTTYEPAVGPWVNVPIGGADEGPGTLFIGEVQGGGQWSYQLKCRPACAFVRTAFEYQYWAVTSEGASEPGSSKGVSAGPLKPAPLSTGGNAHTHLIGFNVGAGISY